MPAWRLLVVLFIYCLSFIELGQYLRGQTRSNEVIKVKSGPCLVPTGKCQDLGERNREYTESGLIS